MDVTCERCRTEYEFDDALVSARGTTVKCTNCGNQFKVRRPEGGAPERWVVRTVDGRELEFLALRDLQAAITKTRVSRDDVLSRGGSRPRRLGSIAELEPFFGQGPSGPAPKGRTPTPLGLGAVGAPTDVSVAIPLPRAATHLYGDALPAAPRAAFPSMPPPPAEPPLPAFPDPTGDTFEGTLDGADTADTYTEAQIAADPSVDGAVTMTLPKATPFPGSAAAVSKPESKPEPARADQEAATRVVKPERPARPLGSAAPSVPPPPPPRNARPASEPPPPRPKSDRPPPGPRPGLRREPSPERGQGDRPSSAMGERPSVMLQERPSMIHERPSMFHEETFSDPRASMVPSSVALSRRGSAGRYIVGSVVVGLVAFGTITVGRKYLASSNPAAAQAPADDRITKLVAEGDRSLAEGNLEAAKTHFDKASALGESEPRVLLALARLAVIRADLAWLNVRLLAEDDPDAQLAERDAKARADAAKKAVDAAASADPEGPAVARLRVDMRRLSGDLGGARALVPSLPPGDASGEGPIGLAALDLAEESPDFPLVVERLRAATAAEQGLGRARAMLVYALARSGDVESAREEFDKIAARPTRHPLLQSLRGYLVRAESGKDAIRAVETAAAAGIQIPNDYREALRRGSQALSSGDYKTAEIMFQVALKKRPGDSEAMTGLAAVAAKAKKDKGEATRLYQQALDANPGYLPAMIALADAKWDAGDKSGALVLYRQILKRDPGGSYGARAKAKLGAAGGGASGASGAGSSAGPSAKSGSGKGPPGDGRVPDDYVWSGDPAAPSGSPSASPGATAAPGDKEGDAPPPAEAPSPVDTSDLPGRVP